jgi:hypothetical protein
MEQFPVLNASAHSDGTQDWQNHFQIKSNFETNCDSHNDNSCYHAKEEREIQKVDLAPTIDPSARGWVQTRSSPFPGAL